MGRRNEENTGLSVKLAVTTAQPAADEHPVVERLHRRLHSLSQEVEEDETLPTEAARTRCIEYFRNVAAGLSPGESLPFPAISTTGRGELSCQWRGADSTLVATVSPTGNLSLHQMCLEQGRVVEQGKIAEATSQELLEALQSFDAIRPAK
jgi:hypothetical protein